MFHHHTLLLAFLAPALAAQSSFGNGNPREIVVPPSSASAFFVGAIDKTHAGLFLTNGTVGGAVLLKTWVVGPGRSGPANVTAVSASRVYFVADDGVNGRELWTSDGTALGTVLVADINPGAVSSHPQQLTPVTIPPGPFVGEIAFTADTAAGGRELWIADATTVTEFAFAPGPATFEPQELTSAGSSRLFFTADDGAIGRELYCIDFSTSPLLSGGLLDLVPGPGSSNPLDVTALGGSVVFSATTAAAGREPWRCDVFAGIPPLLALAPTSLGNLAPGSSGSLPQQFTVVGSTIFFTADDDAVGMELWRSDGTPGGTQLAVDVFPGASSSNPRSLTAGTGVVWFVADDGTHGDELWRAAVAGGSALVQDIVPGTGSSRPRSLLPFQTSELLFSADTPGSGRELWRANLAGANLVVEINSGTCDGRISNLRAFGAAVLFAAEANDGTGQELWRTVGTAVGTQRLENTFPGPDQGTFDMKHAEQSGNLTTEFVTCATVDTGAGAVLFAGGPGPEVNLAAILPLPSVFGTLDLDLGTWIPFSILFATDSSGNPMGGVNPTLTFPASVSAFGVASQIFVFNANGGEFTDVVTWCKATLDLSPCAACAGKNLVINDAHYIDDTFEYEFDCTITGGSETFIKIVKFYADGKDETLFKGATKDGLEAIGEGTELQKGEYVEVQVRCGSDEEACFVTCKLGC